MLTTVVLYVCVHHPSISFCALERFYKKNIVNTVFLFPDCKKKRKRKRKTKKLDASQVPIYNIDSEKIVMRIRLRILLSNEPKVYSSQLENLLRSESSITLHNYRCYDNNKSNMSLSYDSSYSLSPNSPINISITNNIIHPHLCQQDVSNIVFISQTRRHQAHCDNNKALIQSESKNDDRDDATTTTTTSKTSIMKSKRKYRRIQTIIIDKNESNNDQTLIRDVIDDEKIDNINKIASSLSSLSSHCSHNQRIIATPSSHSSSLSVLSGKPICVSNDDKNNNNLSINNNDSSSSTRQNLETQSNNRRSKKRAKKKNRNKRRKN